MRRADRLARPSCDYSELEASFGLFLLPGGLPLRFTDGWASDIHRGGRPRRFPRPLARRSRIMMASSTAARSWRNSASILDMSMFCRSPKLTRSGVVFTLVNNLLSPVAEPAPDVLTHFLLSYKGWIKVFPY